MFYIEKILDAQALDRWIDPEHRLSDAEVRTEAVIHQILVSINKPKPSELMCAFVAVLAIPDAAPHGLGGAS